MVLARADIVCSNVSPASVPAPPPPLAVVVSWPGSEGLAAAGAAAGTPLHAAVPKPKPTPGNMPPVTGTSCVPGGLVARLRLPDVDADVVVVAGVVVVVIVVVLVVRVDVKTDAGRPATVVVVVETVDAVPVRGVLTVV